MHSLIAALIAIIFAWALPRKNNTVQHGAWVLRAAVIGALFPQLDVVFWLIETQFNIPMPERYSLLHTPFLAPFYAGLIASVITVFFKKSWSQIFLASLIGLLTTSLLSMLTVEGVQILPFITPYRLGLGIWHTFDFMLLALGALSLALGLALPIFRRDIARISLLLLSLYFVASLYLYWQAHNVAKAYSRALSLNVNRTYALPQPLSPFNWRLIIVDNNNKLHDTFINLFRKDVLLKDKTASQVYQIQTLYLPIQHAVWRVYDRLGNKNLTKAQQEYAQRAWQHIKTSPNKRKLRFTLLEEFTLPPLNHMTNLEVCAQFTDLRVAGAQKQDGSVFLTCNHKNNQGFTLFQQMRASHDGLPPEFKLLKK